MTQRGRGADWKVRLGIDGVANVITGFNSVLQLFDRAWSKVSALANELEVYNSVLSSHRVSIDEASRAVRQQIDVIDLHRAAARLEQAGLRLTEREMRAVTVAAVQMADSTGGDVREEVERLTRALVGGTNRALRAYGLHLSDSGTIAERQRAQIDALTERFGNQTVEIESLDDAMAQLSNTWGRAWREMALSVERELPGITSLVGRLAAELNDVGNALEAQRRASASMQEAAAAGDLDVQQRLAQRELAQLGFRLGPGNELEVSSHLRVGVAGVGALLTGQDPAARGRRARELRARILATEAEMRENPSWVREAETELAARRTARDVMAAAAAEPPRRPAGGGRSRPAEQPLTLEEMITGLGAVDDPGWERWTRGVEEAYQLAQDLEREKVEAARDHGDILADERARELEGLEAVAEAYQRQKEIADEAEAARRASIRSTADVLLDLGGVFSQITQLIVEAYGEQSEAARIANAVVGTVQAAYHGFMVVSEIADAISDFAKGPIGIAEGLAHVAGAAAHGVAAAKAIADLGGKGSSGGGAAGKAAPVSQSAARPEYSVRESRGERLGGPSVVLEVHGVITSERAAQEIEAALRAANRRRR